MPAISKSKKIHKCENEIGSEPCLFKIERGPKRVSLPWFPTCSPPGLLHTLDLTSLFPMEQNWRKLISMHHKLTVLRQAHSQQRLTSTKTCGIYATHSIPGMSSTHRCWWALMADIRYMQCMVLVVHIYHHIFISDIDISAIFHIPRLFPNSLQTAFLDYTGVIRVKLRATIRDPPNSGPSAHLFFFVIFLVQSRGWFSFQRHEKVGRSWLYPPLMWGNCLAMVFSIKITFNHQNPLAKVTLFVLCHGKTRDLAKFQPRLLFLSVGSDHKRFTSIIHKGKRKMMPYGPTKSPNCQLFNHLHQLNNKKVFARMERAICNGALYR